MANLPVDGSTGWGDTLNAYLTVQAGQITGNSNSISSHAANNPADPHGDRAYASSLVAPITSGVNSPNGYVKTNSSGFIPAALVNGSAATGGIYDNVYDAVTMYGVVSGNGLDQSVALQNALTAAGNAGGGIVFLGQGTYSLANYVVMPSNVWLMMTPGTVLQRISGSSNPAYLITNVVFTTGVTSSQVKITGGFIDSSGPAHITSACTPVFLWQASNAWIEDVRINAPSGAGPAIEVNGCSNVWIQNCNFVGSSGSGITIPAIRVNSSSTSTSPAGFPGGSYNNKEVNGLFVEGCVLSGTGGTYGSLVGSDKVFASANTHSYITITGCSTQYACNSGDVFPGTAIWSNSSWGNNAFFDNGWVNITLDGGWTTDAGIAVPRYRISSDGNLQLSGRVHAAAWTGGKTLNNAHPLPAAYQPAFAVDFYSSDSVGNRAHIGIGTGGVITATAPNGATGTWFAEINGIIPLS